MRFTEKYTTENEKNKIENKDKKVLSEDTFALGEVLQDLVTELKMARIK